MAVSDSVLNLSRGFLRAQAKSAGKTDGVWRTIEGDQKVFIQDGEVRAGGPNGKVVAGDTKPKKPKASRTVLHGTSLDRARSIIAEGIVPKSELQKMAWPGVGDSDQGDKVYTTDSLEVAKWYGSTHALYTEKPKDFAVFEIEVPGDVEGISSRTEGGSKFEVLAYDQIPPEWIKAIHVSKDGEEMVRKAPKDFITNEESTERYAPVFLGDAPAKKGDQAKPKAETKPTLADVAKQADSPEAFIASIPNDSLEIVFHQTGDRAAAAILKEGFKTGKDLKVAEKRGAIYAAGNTVNEGMYARNEEGAANEGQKAAKVAIDIRGLKLFDATKYGSMTEIGSQITRGELDAFTEQGYDGTVRFLKDGSVYELALPESIASKRVMTPEKIAALYEQKRGGQPDAPPKTPKPKSALEFSRSLLAQAKSAMGHAASMEWAAKSKGERWITIGSDSTAPAGSKGGTPVMINGDGEILKGPRDLKGENLKDLGDGKPKKKTPKQPQLTKKQQDQVDALRTQYDIERASEDPEVKVKAKAWDKYSEARKKITGDVDKAREQWNEDRRNEKIAAIRERSKELASKPAWEVTSEEYSASRLIEVQKQAEKDQKKFKPLLDRYLQARKDQKWDEIDAIHKEIENTHGFKAMKERHTKPGQYYGLEGLAEELEYKSKLPREAWMVLQSHKLTEEHRELLKKQVETDIDSVSAKVLKEYEWAEWMPPAAKDRIAIQDTVDGWAKIKDGDQFRKQAREGRKVSSLANAAIDTYREQMLAGQLSREATDRLNAVQSEIDSINAKMEAVADDPKAWNALEEDHYRLYTERNDLKNKIRNDSAIDLAKAIGEGKKSTWKVEGIESTPESQQKQINEAVEWLSTTIAPDLTPEAVRIVAIKPGDKDYSSRSYHLGGVVYLAPHADTATVIHEIGHAIEYANDNKIGKRSNEFLAAKTFDEEVKHLGKGYEKYEVATQNGFKNAYTGKYYSGSATEILSMGLQHMYEDPVGFAEQSPDHFNYTAAVMQGLIQ